MDLSLFGQSRDVEGRRPAALPGLGVGARVASPPCPILLWDYRHRGWALRHWKHWYFWATDSRLKPMVKVARMIHGHLDNVLTYFDHRITKATKEGLNSKIHTIKYAIMVSAIGSI